MVGHYPIAGWLRIACSFIKQKATGTKWEDYIGLEAEMLLKDLMNCIKKQDPVGGIWCVDNESKKATVLADASSIAIGACVEIGNDIVEDAAWLRKTDDGNHINVAELEAVIKGISLGLKWCVNEIDLMTDSATVYGWLVAMLDKSHRIKTKSASAMDKKVAVLLCSTM